MAESENWRTWLSKTIRYINKENNYLLPEAETLEKFADEVQEVIKAAEKSLGEKDNLHVLYHHHKKAKQYEKGMERLERRMDVWLKRILGAIARETAAIEKRDERLKEDIAKKESEG